MNCSTSKLAFADQFSQMLSSKLPEINSILSIDSVCPFKLMSKLLLGGSPNSPLRIKNICYK